MPNTPPLLRLRNVRLFEQITNSDGYVDVRDIKSIGCLDGKGGIRLPTVHGYEECHTTPITTTNNEEKEEDSMHEQEEEEDDVGGEEVMPWQRIVPP